MSLVHPNRQAPGRDALETVEDGEGLSTVNALFLYHAASDILVQKFYLEGRTKAAFPFHESPTYTVVSTRAEYSTVRSTKADMLVALVCHHLSTNSLAPVSFDHHPMLPCIVNASDHPILNRPWVPGPGADAPPCPLWTPLETGEGTQMPQLKTGSRKILIYHEFAMMAPLILSVSGNCRPRELALFDLCSSFFKDFQGIWNQRCGSKRYAKRRRT
jgi:hypothetical protein